MLQKVKNPNFFNFISKPFHVSSCKSFFNAGGGGGGATRASTPHNLRAFERVPESTPRATLKKRDKEEGSEKGGCNKKAIRKVVKRWR